MALTLLIVLFEFSRLSLLPTFAEENNGLEELIAKASKTYFVSVSGDDNSPGTADRPWATINHAAETIKAGGTVIVRGGRYVLHAQVRPHNSGRSDAWITFMGFPSEEPILDAQLLPRSSLFIGGLDNGAFQIEGLSYVRVANLNIINSHDAGFTVRDSSNIELINNSTKGTFSSGIAVWDTNHDHKTQRIRILGNTITKATTWDLAPLDVPRRGEPPHEALSIGGAINFEVAFNHVYDSDKEGIDIKETSHLGTVHHNLVDAVDRQGIYIDAWFGKLTDVDVFSNVIHDCRMAGLILSVESGQSVERINIHDNLVFNNEGSGLLFSRWGVDGPRKNVKIYNNIFYHNGFGPPTAGQSYYWLTGGLYLSTTNLQDILIANNILSDNSGFQIGYSELFLKDFRSWPVIAHEKKIRIVANLIDGRNIVDSPIESGGDAPDRMKIYAIDGDRAIIGHPVFRDPAKQDFALRRGSPAAFGCAATGSCSFKSLSMAWWKQNFPPILLRANLDHLRIRTIPD